jgi:sugar transport system substrate-binding protein
MLRSRMLPGFLVHRHVVFVTLLSLLLILAACGTSSGSSSSSSAQLRIGALYLDQQGFYGGIAKGIKDGAGSNHINLIAANSASDASKEASFMSTLVTDHVQAIIMSPVSATGSAVSVKSAIQAGIPVVCYNSCIDNAQSVGVYANVTTDQTQFGAATGTEAGNYFKNQGIMDPKIGILNCDIYEACAQRKAGFKQALLSVLPNAQFVIDQQGFDPDKAATVATAELTAHPDLNAIWTANEGGTIGAVNAVKSTPSSHAVVFGSDIDTQIAQFLLNSPKVLIATNAQNPQEMGKQAIQIAMDAINHKAVENFTIYVPFKVYTSSDPTAVNSWLQQHTDGLP